MRIETFEQFVKAFGATRITDKELQELRERWEAKMGTVCDICDDCICVGEEEDCSGRALMTALCQRLSMTVDQVREAFQSGQLVCTKMDPGKGDEIVSVTEIPMTTRPFPIEAHGGSRDRFENFRFKVEIPEGPQPPGVATCNITLERTIEVQDTFKDWVLRSLGIPKRMLRGGGRR